MVKNKDKAQSAKISKFSQIKQVFAMTRKDRKINILWFAISFLIPVVVFVALAIILHAGILSYILWILLGVLTGLIVMMIVVGKIAEKLAYKQIEGKPGAVSAILKTTLKRQFIGSEMPVAVNIKTQDALYRVVGKCGVVLIGEGSNIRCQKLCVAEKQKIGRAIGDIKISYVHIGNGDKDIHISKIAKYLNSQKRILKRAQVYQVAERLTSLNKGYGVPKGMHAGNMKINRKAIRG